MAQGVEISRGKYADTLHDTQSFLLGERVKDNKTQTEWTYVRFDEILNLGDFVRDSITSDLVAIESGTTYAQATAVSAIGSNLLIDSGQFTDKDYVGAFGMISDNAGVGQIFYIEAMDDVNQVKIRVIATAAGQLGLNDDRGWQVALAANSRYRLRFPGAVRQGDGLNDFVRGFVQHEIVAADLGKYGFVCSKGLCFGRFVADDSSVPAAGTPFIPRAGGLITGAINTDTEAVNVIAKSHLGGNTSPSNGVVLIDAQIDDPTLAFRGRDGDTDPRIRIHIE